MDNNYIEDLINNISLNSDINFDLFKEVVLSEAFLSNIELIQNTRKSNISEVENSCLTISKLFLKNFNLNEFVKKYNINVNMLLAEVKSYLFMGTPLDKNNSELIKTFFIKQTQLIIYTIILDLPKNYTFSSISFNRERITA